MKGILNKFKAGVKGIVGGESQTSPSKKPSKPIESPLKDTGAEEGQTLRKSRTFFPSKKIVPKTREEIVKGCLNSAKCLKFFEALNQDSEKEGENKPFHNYNVYFKDNSKPISMVFKEKLQEMDNLELAPSEISNILNVSQPVIDKEDMPLLCISVIKSDSGEGAGLEYMYPNLEKDLNLDNELVNFLELSLVSSAMPDAAQNTNEDFVYFIIDINKKKFEKLNTESFLKVSKDTNNDHALLYGVSFFKQIPVTVAMKQENPNLDKSHTYKAVCILSKAPLFGHILAKLDPVTRIYLSQDDFKDTQILRNIYDNINSSLKEITINLNELLAGTCTKKLVYFLKEKVMTLWKALFLEKRILVFSQHPSACSTFIHSLLALYPGLCHFRYSSKALSLSENHYNEYGLPLRFFHEDCPIVPYFSNQNADTVASAQGYLAGTSDPSIKSLPKINWDILVDIDKNSIQFKNDSLKKVLALTRKDKEFIQNIIKRVKSHNSAESLSWKNIENSIFDDVVLSYKGSEDWIRQKFYDHLKLILNEVEFFRYCASDEKLSASIEEFNAFLTNKGQVDEVFDWKDEILSPEDERKDGDQTEDEDIILASPMSQKSKGSKGKKSHYESSQDDFEDLVERQKQLDDLEEKKVGEDKDKDKKDIKSPLRISKSLSTELKSPQDPKNSLKNELKPLKESKLVIRKFGFDWLINWAKTSNFQWWLNSHTGIIGERSQINRYIENHFWCYENGDIYFGEIRYGEKIGMGLFADVQAKIVYIGEWEENKKSGNGKIISLETGNLIYEGGFSNNKKHGVGKLVQNNEKYTGSFSVDLYEGNGTLVDKNNNTYEGDFKEGYKWGMGKLQLANGDIYTGEFVKDKYHGKGQLICKNGDFYSGDFQEGLKWGLGIYHTATGEVYEGEFQRDLYNGLGKLKKKDKYVFEGLFKDGKLIDNMEGTIYYPDGSKYHGMICNSKAHGHGVLTKQDEKNDIVYSGKFDNDKLIEEASEKMIIDKQSHSNNNQEGANHA